MYTGDQSSASVTELDAWMDHYGIPHNTYSDDEGYQVTASDHNWPIWMKLIMSYAADYLWEDSAEEPAADPTPAAPGAAATYTVLKGDSLWKIAQKFYGTGAKWTAIYETNRNVLKDSYTIYTGQELVIPKD